MKQTPRNNLNDKPGHKTEVVIVGGGPVGLYLALRLQKLGIESRILEQKMKVDRHTKSLGIHPVSLEIFEEIGIAGPFLSNGIKIRKGHAFIDRSRTGTISFENCPKPFNFILALPQYETEEILEQTLRSAAPDCLERGARVTKIETVPGSVLVQYEKNGIPQTVARKYVVGCDGKNSIVRHSAGISFPGKSYPDTYLMGDFRDNTNFGSDAAVYLHRDGLIESFPLPDGYRRWVVKTDSYIKDPIRNLLDRLIFQRIGHSLNGTDNQMLSSFGVQHHMASSFYRNRCLLAGDSAHIVSPIGGQGMNLGWLTARDLAVSLSKAMHEPENAGSILTGFSNRNRKIARIIAKRAELNMWLGCKRSFPFLRNFIVRLIVNTPLQNRMARVFTMRGLNGS